MVEEQKPPVPLSPGVILPGNDSPRLLGIRRWFNVSGSVREAYGAGARHGCRVEAWPCTEGISSNSVRRTRRAAEGAARNEASFRHNAALYEACRLGALRCVGERFQLFGGVKNELMQ